MSTYRDLLDEVETLRGELAGARAGRRLEITEIEADSQKLEWFRNELERLSAERDQALADGAAMIGIVAEMAAELTAANAKVESLLAELGDQQAYEDLRAERDAAFQNGVDEGSSGGWWDAAVRADMEVDALIVADAPEQFIAGAQHVADDLKETEHSAEGYKKFRKAIRDFGFAEGEARGFLAAIEALRDRERYDAWCVASGSKSNFGEYTRSHFAAYLESEGAAND